MTLCSYASERRRDKSFEKLCVKMEREGWTRKDFKSSDHYRGWYYRNRKKVERSGKWHIDYPFTFWYRPLQNPKLTTESEK